jgi:DNA-binding MarR family transcriptional regulator
MASKSPDRSIRSSGNASVKLSPRMRDARLVFDSIRRIVRVLRLQARHTEKAFGLSAAQLFVLHKLAESPALTPTELAEKALTDQSSVSVVVQRLVDRGYVHRARSSRDARSFELSLSEAGRTVVQNSPDSTQDRLLGAIERMPAGRVKVLASLLDELVSNTGLSRQYPTMLGEEEDGPGSAGGPRAG